MSSSIDETNKRLEVVEDINVYINESDLSGLLVTGSIAWGKNYAVSETSDIDFYLLAPNINSFYSSLDNLPHIPKNTIDTFKKMLDYKTDSVDTVSMKTDIGDFNGSIYLFLEKDILNLTNQMRGKSSKFFTNLRPHSKQQTKEYKSLNGLMMDFTTPIKHINDDLYIRTDPVFLFENNEFYGSILISHLLFGEIYTDKNNTLYTAQDIVRKYLKSLLPDTKDKAIVKFKNYLPRIERMNEETINSLFNSIWQN